MCALLAPLRPPPTMLNPLRCPASFSALRSAKCTQVCVVLNSAPTQIRPDPRPLVPTFFAGMLGAQTKTGKQFCVFVVQEWKPAEDA